MLINKNFYYSGLELNENETYCEEYGCGDICRCSKIVNQK
jgi:hypothetical protein